MVCTTEVAVEHESHSRVKRLLTILVMAGPGLFGVLAVAGILGDQVPLENQITVILFALSLVWLGPALYYFMRFADRPRTFLCREGLFKSTASGLVMPLRLPEKVEFDLFDEKEVFHQLYGVQHEKEDQLSQDEDEDGLFDAGTVDREFSDSLRDGMMLWAGGWEDCGPAPDETFRFYRRWTSVLGFFYLFLVPMTLSWWTIVQELFQPWEQRTMMITDLGIGIALSILPLVYLLYCRSQHVVIDSDGITAPSVPLTRKRILWKDVKSLSRLDWGYSDLTIDAGKKKIKIADHYDDFHRIEVLIRYMMPKNTPISIPNGDPLWAEEMKGINRAKPDPAGAAAKHEEEERKVINFPH
jgi:hypothetical protein